MASRRDQIKLSDQEVDGFLAEQRTVICATNGRNGWPHLMPLWYVLRPSGPGGAVELWAWTFAKSQKTRNLERDARATLQVETGEQYQELRGVMFETRATIHRDVDTVLGVGMEVFRRYTPGIDGELADEVVAMVRAQAEKRVAFQFVEQRRASWDHRKLGGVYERAASRRYPAQRMERLKGLILSGGRGTRLRPITYTSAKQLVPVANRPVLFYGIEAMARAGIEEIGIIIAPETGDEIRAEAGDGSKFGVRIEYIVQDEPAGLAHAVLTAEPFLGTDPFVMYLGDNLLQGGIKNLVDAFRSGQPEALILLTAVDDPENYGVAELDGDRVKRLQEKPPEPQTNLALVGVYMFTAAIHDAARAIEPSARGELEITDAIQHLVDAGRRVEPHIVEGWWKDTGRLEDMLEANRLVLDTIETRVDGSLDDASSCDGRVIIEAGATLVRSTVRGPAIIGAGARLTDAYVGPYSAIGENCVIERAEVEHSILLAGSQARDLPARLESSLLGRDARVRRDDGQPRALRLLVGDNSEIAVV